MERHRVVVKVLPARPVSGIRISLHLYNSPTDVESLLAALRAEVRA
jgi:selenocysteine lyase/cysteine desulfurase